MFMPNTRNSALAQHIYNDTIIIAGGMESYELLYGSLNNGAPKMSMS